MTVKKFRQPTVREALREIREELGGDALVLSSEMVPARGWRGWVGLREVEVTVTPPREAAASRPAATERRVADSRSVRDGLVARMVASGLDPTLAAAVADRVPSRDHRGASLHQLRRGLADVVASLTAVDVDFAPVEVFIGPPGVGKTTTIAKIAAQTRARANRILGMVAADAFRAGAVEHLRTYATIIGAPFRIARSAEELDAALASARHAVLVDTAGRSHAEASLRDVRRLVGNRRDVRTHLVIAADTSPATAQRILDAYHDARPDRLVISKVDEADSLSPLLEVIRGRSLPVSYLTTGQRIPEDLERATPEALAVALLRDRRASLAHAS
jgi:flagellar biosynthesis protein FlhF